MTDSPAFRDNIKQQLRELIKQNYNHPSVFFWSMYNEPWVSGKGGTANTQEEWKLVGELVDLAHQLDPTRLTTGAVVKGVQGPINWYMDITGTNRYEGWYEGTPEDWPGMLSTLRSSYPDKKLGISEYGAGGSVIQHQDSLKHPAPKSRWHPEEWQAVVHEHAWDAMRTQDWLWCKLIWCMFDFSSIGRNEGDTAGINDKGLVTADRKTRKDAYYFYKACWTTDPFVYITDRRFNPRGSGNMELKVYSNCDTVDLRVAGKSLGKRTSTDHVFRWPGIELKAGDIQVEATGTSGSQSCSDLLTWTILPTAPTTAPATTP